MPQSDTIQCFAQAVEVAEMVGAGITLSAGEAVEICGELQRLQAVNRAMLAACKIARTFMGYRFADSMAISPYGKKVNEVIDALDSAIAKAEDGGC